MSKKILILAVIIILAIVITASSYFIKITPPGQYDASTSYRGLIVPYWNQTHATYDFGTGNFPIFPPEFNWIVFLIDILLWMLIIKIVFIIISKIIKVFKK